MSVISIQQWLRVSVSSLHPSPLFSLSASIALYRDSRCIGMQSASPESEIYSRDICDKVHRGWLKGSSDRSCIEVQRSAMDPSSSSSSAMPSFLRFRWATLRNCDREIERGWEKRRVVGKNELNSLPSSLSGRSHDADCETALPLLDIPCWAKCNLSFRFTEERERALHRVALDAALRDSIFIGMRFYVIPVLIRVIFSLNLPLSLFLSFYMYI